MIKKYKFLIKNIFIAIAMFYAFFMSAAYADIPFTDVSKTDSYYNDLNFLYSQGIIKDNDSHKFNPDSLIKRDEFVGIVIGVGCKDCINPSIEDIIRYRINPFDDLGKNNPYFYCISIGKNDGIIQGYTLDSEGKYTCQNNKTSTSNPFCPENNITRIEATTILLNSAKIPVNTGLNMKKTIDIDDVNDSWYPFAQKGIEVGLLTLDNHNKVYPNEFINRKEFIKMAVKIFGINSCELKQDITNNNLSSGIKIFDPKNKNSCIGGGDLIDFSDSQSNKFDFFGYTESGGDFTYNWEFTNPAGEKIAVEGECLNDYILKTNGIWTVKLTLTDIKTGDKSASFSQITVNDANNKPITDISDNINKNNISALISATPISGQGPLNVNFDAITNAIGNATYSWDFGDGSNSSEKNPDHTFTNPGNYVVILNIKDKDGNVGISQIVIEVLKTSDRDRDGILDEVDLCPDVVGPSSNKGCPIIKEFDSNKAYPNTLSSDIKIFDADNRLGLKGKETTFPDNTKTAYDFFGVTEDSGNFSYEWEFKNITTGDVLNMNGQFLNDFDLKTPGVWSIKSTITDKDTGKNSTSYSQIAVNSKNNDGGISTNISVNPLSGSSPLKVNMTSVVNGGDGEYKYLWNFCDGTSSTDSNPIHTFNVSGVCPIILNVTDSIGNKSISELKINVLGAKGSDSDGDGVKSPDDFCPNISGNQDNHGCPNSQINFGISNKCVLDKALNNGFINGLLQCNQCPCTGSIEFLSTIKSCDIIFPAITSPDKKNIYSRGAVYQVK